MVLNPIYTFNDSYSFPDVLFFKPTGKEWYRVSGGVMHKCNINRDSDYYIKHKMFKRNYKRTVK